MNVFFLINFSFKKKYWLVNKQMKFEGGFQGRTNKLVDTCYSFWQAGQFPIIHSILSKGKFITLLFLGIQYLFIYIN